MQATNLVDEQKIIESLPTRNSKQPATCFGTGYGNGRITSEPEDKDKYLTYDFDLGETHQLERVVFYYQQFAKELQAFKPTIEIYTGDTYELLTSESQKVASINLREASDGNQEDGNNINQWIALSLTDIVANKELLKTRHVRLKITNEKKRVYLGEVLAYGEPLGMNKKEQPKVSTTKKKLSMEQFIGVNSFNWKTDLTDYNNSGNIREYNTLRQTVLEPKNEGKFDWKGTNLDQFYRTTKKAGILVHPVLQDGLPYYNQSDTGIPVKDYTKDALDNPLSYKEHAYVMYQYAARYGANKKIDPQTLNNLSATDKEVGLDYLEYYENWNEPDGLWKWINGDEASNPKKTGGGFLAPEYAAMTSADYDGHGGELAQEAVGKQAYGIRDADQDAKLVMAGLAYFNLDYVKAVDYWLVNNRKDHQNPLAAINLHHYSGKMSPEEDQLYEQLSMISRYLTELNPNQEIWLSEFGWDTDQPKDISEEGQSVMAPSQLAQAQWLTREYLIGAAVGLDRMQMYMLDGHDFSAQKFATSGLLNRRSSIRKPSFYYTHSLKNILQGTYFESIVEMSNQVYALQFKEGETDIYALWRPTSNGSSSLYKLPVGDSQEVMMTKLIDGSLTGESQGLLNENGTITVPINETPIFITVKKGEKNVPMPTTDVTPKAYYKEVDVKLKAYYDHRIYYTLDGSLPSEKSTEFKRGDTLHLTDTTSIKAIAIDKNDNQSQVADLGFSITKEFKLGSMTVKGGQLVGTDFTKKDQTIYVEPEATELLLNFTSKSALEYPLYYNMTTEEIINDRQNKQSIGIVGYAYKPLKVDLRENETEFTITMKDANRCEFHKEYVFKIKRGSADEEAKTPVNSHLLPVKAGAIENLTGSNKGYPMEQGFDAQPTIEKNQLVMSKPGENFNSKEGDRQGYVDFGANWQNTRVTGLYTLYTPYTAGSVVVPFKHIWWSETKEKGQQFTEEKEEKALNFSSRTDFLYTGETARWFRDYYQPNNPIIPKERYLLVESQPNSGIRVQEYALTGYYQDQVSSADLTIKFLGEDGEALHSEVKLVDLVNQEIDLRNNEDIKKAIKEVEENYYQLAKRPENEAAVPMTESGASVSYQFKGKLFVQDVPEELRFKNGIVSIVSQELAYDGDQDFVVRVIDTRGQVGPAVGNCRGQFKLAVKLANSFKNFNGQELKGSAICFKNSKGEKMIGPETSIIVYDGQEKQEDNMISIPLDDKKTGGGNRLSIQVPNDSRLVEGDYYAEIIWEIQNVL